MSERRTPALAACAIIAGLTSPRTAAAQTAAPPVRLSAATQAAAHVGVATQAAAHFGAATQAAPHVGAATQAAPHLGAAQTAPRPEVATQAASPPARLASPVAPHERGLVSDLARALGLASADSFLVQGYRQQLGAGFGSRAGYALGLGLYLGATYAVDGGPFILGLEASAQGARDGLAYVGPELGVDLRSGPLHLRPYVATGVGVARPRSGGPTPEGVGDVVAWPGLSLSYLVRHLSVGADLRPAGALLPGAQPEVCAFGTLGLSL